MSKRGKVFVFDQYKTTSCLSNFLGGRDEPSCLGVHQIRGFSSTKVCTEAVRGVLYFVDER